MKLVNIPSYIDENAINYISIILEATNESDFDEEVFDEWLIMVDVEHKNNPSGYLRSCFKRELENGTYKPKAKVEFVPNTQEIINELRDRGMTILADDCVWLGVVLHHILNAKNMPISECKELQRKILTYMKNPKSFEEYKKLLMNANTLKQFNINWKLLEAKTQSHIETWNKLLDEIESEE